MKKAILGQLTSFHGSNVRDFLNSKLHLSVPNTKYEPFVEPGPLNRNVLKLQGSHRYSQLWAGEEVCSIFFRNGPKPPTNLDERVVNRLRVAGFYGMYRMGEMKKYDCALFEALVERWRMETHTFHLPVGEMTITLQDVGVLISLPIDGLPVTGLQTYMTDAEWADLCFELLGVRPGPPNLKTGMLMIKWLMEQFSNIGNLEENAIEADIDRYTLLEKVWF